MRNQRKFFGVVVVLVMALVAVQTACAPEATPEPQVIEQTIVVEVEKEVTRIVEGTPVVETVVETVVEVVTATPEPPPPEEPVKRVLVVAQGADPQTLDAGMTTGTTTANVIHNIYDTLVIRDDDMSVIPGLALSWEPINETTWRFTLRPDVTFHNGEAFNADAVKYSIERVVNPDQAAPQASYLSTVDSVEVVDDYTVDVITSVPDPILIPRLTKAVASIVPPQYTQEVGDEAAALEPVGTGPFMFVEWVKDDHLSLEVNPDYWRDLPEYDVLVFKPIPNAAARTAALLAGDVGMVYNVPVSQIDVVSESTHTKLASVDIQAGEYVGFNTRHEDSPLQDVRIRQAINYAIDVDTIIATILEGHATRRASPVTPLDFGYVELDPYPYDPEMAKQLLAEAGVATGLSLHYDTCNGRYPMDKQVSEVVASMLESVGIDVELQVHEWGAYLSLFKDDEIGDLFLLGWGSISTLDADAALYSELHCGGTYSTHCSPDLDELLEEARAIIDPDRRMELYEQIQRLILEEPPWVFMYQEQQFYGMSSKVTWSPRADSLLNLYHVEVSE